MADKKAMSRALGAAFLNHQVEQLEKSAASRNWRSASPNPQARRMQQQHGATNNATNNSNYNSKSAPRKKNPAGVLIIPNAQGRRSVEEQQQEKDADVVVVDASVLVHALHQVKKWARDGRAEVIIVPLEALNTLDLLKKGTSPIAQRARAASRMLEAQVGSNPRIRVQQDDAFVPWDAIALQDAPTPELPDETSPEWVRRTVCCACWEVDAAAKDKKKGASDEAEKPKQRTVRLAVLARAPAADAAVPTDGTNTNKHEPRAAGALVTHWATRARIALLPIEPSVPNANANSTGTANTAHGATAAQDPSRRPRSGTQTKRGVPNAGTGGGSLVERPAAALALERELHTGTSPRVIRVLARGERLDAAPA